MNQIYHSIDLSWYNRNEEDSFFAEGWVIVPGAKKIRIAVYDQDNRRLESAVQWKERPDIREARADLEVPEKPGFQIKVLHISDCLESLECLKLVVFADGVSRMFARLDGAQIKKTVTDSTILYKVDVLQLLETELVLQGWFIDQQGVDQIRVLDGRGRKVPCSIRRIVREDVQEEYRNYIGENAKIGFFIRIKKEHIRTRRVRVCFQSRSACREYVVDMREQERQFTRAGRLYNVLRPGKLSDNLNYIREHDLESFRDYVRRSVFLGTSNYHVWAKRNRIDRRELKRQKSHRFLRTPVISIVIPLYNTPVRYLKELLDSVMAQTYSRWELCLADGSTTDEAERYILSNYRKEPRIKYRRLEKNGGISENTNAAIAMASGEYVMLSDHDDVIEPGALYEIVRAVNENPELDILYTDEDKITMDSQSYFEPNFKPDYNPFMLESTNYICHIFVVRASILEKIGGFRKEFDGAQDYDLILRCCEETTEERICHIPKALYHWRSHPESTAADPQSKPYAYRAGARALDEHFARTGVKAFAEISHPPGVYRIRREVEGKPLISVIIPNKDHTEDLEKCLSSVTEKTTYDHYEILVVENNSKDPATFAYYREMEQKYPRCRLLTWKGEFNYSAINNYAAGEAKGEYFLFLNNDVELISGDWMQELLGIGQLPQVGIVGARLYYPDDTVQHAGVILGLGGAAGHIFSCESRYEPGYMARAFLPQNLSAVTAACMLAKRSVFEKAGGFDERLKVAFNDVDLCIKVRAAGFQVVYDPFVELYHYESRTRGPENTDRKKKRFEGETALFKNRWKEILKKGDPYYNPNLSLEGGGCNLRE